LVAPDHPDAAKLPCARCRRFALECVRVKVSKRKGPAPVYVHQADDICSCSISATSVQYQMQLMVSSPQLYRQIRTLSTILFHGRSQPAETPCWLQGRLLTRESTLGSRLIPDSTSPRHHHHFLYWRILLRYYYTHCPRTLIRWLQGMSLITSSMSSSTM